MKLLWFIYYHSVINSEKYTPKRKDHHAQAIFELTVGFTTFIVMGIVKGLDDLGIWKWIKVNWPYDYGHMHSKNWIAPAGLLLLLFYFINRAVIKSYFLSPNVRSKIFLMFKDKDSGVKIGGYSSVIFWIFSLLLSVFIGAGAWKLVFFCVLLTLLLEYWIRKTFT